MRTSKAPFSEGAFYVSERFIFIFKNYEKQRPQRKVPRIKRCKQKHNTKVKNKGDYDYDD